MAKDVGSDYRVSYHLQQSLADRVGNYQVIFTFLIRRWQSRGIKDGKHTFVLCGEKIAIAIAANGGNVDSEKPEREFLSYFISSMCLLFKNIAYVRSFSIFVFVFVFVFVCKRIF